MTIPRYGWSIQAPNKEPLTTMQPRKDATVGIYNVDYHRVQRATPWGSYIDLKHHDIWHREVVIQSDNAPMRIQYEHQQAEWSYDMAYCCPFDEDGLLKVRELNTDQEAVVDTRRYLLVYRRFPPRPPHLD